MIELSFEKHTLDFISPARTSRGEYVQKSVLLIALHDGHHKGIGEASPLPDLSIDGQSDLTIPLENIQIQLREGQAMDSIIAGLNHYPSLQFALECAWLGLQSKSEKLFDTEFTRREKGIQINGLVWMNDIESMLQSAFDKVEQGFRCIKFKIGALDHDDECRMTERLRKKYNSHQLEIRVDANGAFSPDDALKKIKDFSKFEIHSIEQPINAGQWDAMQEICAKSKIDIALDEELIGVNEAEIGEKMLSFIAPEYLILKPTLLGGFGRSDKWIQLAEKQGIQWWATSALESNIGLDHIAQWVSGKQTDMPQGLGTGALYKNNFIAKSRLIKDVMWYENPLHL